MTLKNHSLTAPKPAALNDRLEGLPDSDLLSLRHEIDKRLNIDLSKLNLAEELGLQYRAGSTLLASVQSDKEVPANQKSQVFNSVGAMLDKIGKQMKVAFSAERLKRYEVAFLKVLDHDDMPKHMRKVFFDLYGEYLAQDDKPARAE